MVAQGVLIILRNFGDCTQFIHNIFYFKPEMNCILVTCLLVFAKTVLTDSSEDPSGWNSLFETNSHYYTDGVEIVDPSGWNYDRESKSSIRSEQEDTKQIEKFRESVAEKKNFQVNHKVENVIKVAINSKIETLVNKTPRGENIAFARRFVSILLQSADLSRKTVDDGQEISGFIEIRVSAEHLKTLVHFTNSIVNVSMGELDSILTASIHSSHYPGSRISELMDQTIIMASQKQIWLPFFLVLIMFGLYQPIKTRLTTRRLVISVTFLIFTVGYVVEYYRMYKEIEIRQRITLEKHGDVPSSCSSKDSSLWTAVQNSFAIFSTKNDDCEQYYKAAYLDPLVEVSPVRVLSSVLSDFILHPSKKIGTAIAEFTSEVIGGLPVQYGWIVWIVSSFGSILLIAFALLIIIGGSVRFNSWIGDVSVRGNHTSQITQPPPAEPEITAPQAPPLPPANAVLQAANKMSSFVLMDANSLETLMFRSQRNASFHPSGVEELTNLSRNRLPSRPSVDKNDLIEVQQERLSSIMENTHPNSGKCANVEEEQEIACESINLQEKKVDSKSTDSPIVQEELLVSFEVIQSTEIQSSSSEANVLKSEVGLNSMMEAKGKME